MTSDNQAAGARITGLDVTRGFAVMGILAMNIVAFAMPQGAYIAPVSWGGDTGPDLWIWAVNYVLVDSKMRGLFSMLFGASTLLVIDGAVAAGRSPARTHYGRMAALLLFGAIHFYLIWFGDILFLYAAVGMLLYLFRNRPVKSLLRWAASMFTLALLIAGLQFGTLSLGANPAMPEPLREAYQRVEGMFAHGSEASQKDIALYRGPYTAMVAERFRKEWFSPLVNVVMYGAETLSLMLIGMALFRSGMLRGEWPLDRLAKWRNRCLGIGIAANLVLLWWQFHMGLDPIILLLSTFFLSVPFDFLMSIGYAALFMGLAQRFASSAMIARVAATGRAAFSNYLGTSILMTALFYGWGLGQFGHWSRIEVYGPVLGMWALMLLWSKPWLDRFNYGPMEWLWRSLSRLSLQPMRRRA